MVCRITIRIDKRNIKCKCYNSGFCKFNSDCQFAHPSTICIERSGENTGCPSRHPTPPGVIDSIVEKIYLCLGPQEKDDIWSKNEWLKTTGGQKLRTKEWNKWHENKDPDNKETSRKIWAREKLVRCKGFTC